MLCHSLADQADLSSLPGLIADFPSWLPAIFPSLETLSLAHNAFRYLPPSITLFDQLRRVKTHGNQLARSGHHRGRVRHNTKDIVRLLRNAPPTVEGLPKVESLSVTCVRVLRGVTRGQEAGVEAATDGLDVLRLDDSTEDGCLAAGSRSGTPTQRSLPPHLEQLVTESYTCCSCHAFVAASSAAFLPALYERMHHLDPGVALPARLPGSTSSSAAPHTPVAATPASASSSRSSSMSRPLPSPGTTVSSPIPFVQPRPGRTPSFASSSPPLSASPSPSASPAQASFPPPPHRLTLEEKVLLLLIGRGLDLTTFVVGDTEGYRFCKACARAHLGVIEEACGCEVCRGESRWREEEEGNEGGVMRWLRRRAGRMRA